MWGTFKERYGTFAAAVIAGLLGLGAAIGLDIRRFEESLPYAIIVACLVAVTLVANFQRIKATDNVGSVIAPAIVTLLAMGFCSWVVTANAGIVDDYGPERVMAMFMVFVPLARMTGDRRKAWNAVPGVAALCVIVIPTMWISSEMATVSYPMTVVAFAMGGVALATTVKMPKWSNSGVLPRVDRLVFLTAMFLIGMTLVEGSFDYDWKASAFVGVLLAIIGYILSLLVKKAVPGVGMSYLMGTSNLVLALWLGIFMPGAGVIALIALMSGWALHLSVKWTSDWWTRRRVRHTPTA